MGRLAARRSWLRPTGHCPLGFLEHQQAGEVKLTEAGVSDQQPPNHPAFGG